MSDMKWYMAMNGWRGRTARVQVGHTWQSGPAVYLPEPIVRAAAAEYERQGYGQNFETLQRRGGLGVEEVIALLADALKVTGQDSRTSIGDTESPPNSGV